jgi:cytochrome c oxidase assembly protein subunit 15
LAGVLAGFPVLALLIFTLINIRKDWFLFLLSAATTFMLGFEAWLGKLVVDGNLIPNQITIHMMGALIIIGLLLAIMARTRKKPVSRKAVLFPFNSTLLFVLFLSLLQIVLGTQVREEVDEVAKIASRENWIESLSSLFEIHRSFAIAVIFANGILLWINRRKRYGIVLTKWIMITIIIEVVLGIILSYAGMPAWAQPMHLFFAVVMFSFQLYLLLNVLRRPYRSRVIPKS